MSLLSITGLTVEYMGAVRALDDIDLTVERGSVTALLGNNGAGKSTLLRAASGILTHSGGEISHGEISFNGQTITKMPAPVIVANGLVHVPEGRDVFTRLSVADNLRIGAFSRGKNKYSSTLAWVYELFPNLSDRRNLRASLLSGGEQQMLAIGRALMSRPTMLLLDEPSLGLAPKLVEQISDVVLRIRSEGTTVLLVEQNAAMALALASDVVVLDVGQITHVSDAASARSDKRLVDHFLGAGTSDAHIDDAEDSETNGYPVLRPWKDS